MRVLPPPSSLVCVSYIRPDYPTTTISHRKMVLLNLIKKTSGFSWHRIVLFLQDSTRAAVSSSVAFIFLTRFDLE
jgi:hypothetical protein